MNLATQRPGVLLVVLFSACLSGCRQPVPAPEPLAPWFEDITDKVGLKFVHQTASLDRYPLPQLMGSGCAIFDSDGDGRLDIYLVHNGGPNGKKNQLFRQKQDGTFTDVSAGSGLDVAGFGMGVTIGEINNDGLPDVLLTGFGRTRLFLSLGQGKFREITREAGVDSPLWATSAAFVDYDRDGWLDLIVVNYVDYNPSERCVDGAGRPGFCPPSRYFTSGARLYRNRGAAAWNPPRGPAFEDVTVPSGIGQRPGPALGVVCADFDGDGWPDLFVANDGKANHLWINQKNGTFKEEAVRRGLAFNGMGQAEANMGIAIGDVDGDGLFDVLVSHLTEETHTLWGQGPVGHFRDRSLVSGVASPLWRGTGFGTVLADFDHDGLLDLVVVHGRVSRGQTKLPAAQWPAGLTAFWSDYAELNQLFAGQEKGRFRDRSRAEPGLCGLPNVARGLAVADIDGDGALDLLVTSVGGPARLFRNVAPDRGHWLLVGAIDPALNRDAYGAVLTVEAGNRRLVGMVNPNQSYLSSHDGRVHFGLGDARRADVRVLWPDGSEEVFADQSADRVVVLRKGQGKGVKR